MSAGYAWDSLRHVLKGIAVDLPLSVTSVIPYEIIKGL